MNDPIVETCCQLGHFSAKFIEVCFNFYNCTFEAVPFMKRSVSFCLPDVSEFIDQFELDFNQAEIAKAPSLIKNKTKHASLK